MGELQLFAAIGGGVLAIIGTVLGTRTNKAGARENLFMDQIQEQLATERAAREKLEERMDLMARQMQHLTNVNGLWSLHAVRVESQVLDLGGTPHERPPLLR